MSQTVAEKAREISHKICTETEPQDKLAFEYILSLVRPLLQEIEIYRGTLERIQTDHFNPLNNRCEECSAKIEEALRYGKY